MDTLNRLEESGFVTLELMIALAYIISVLSAVIMVTFGNQILILDSQTNNEAMNYTQELLERTEALSRKDFNLVNPIASSTEDIYEKSVSVTLQPDFRTKSVTSAVSWKNARLGTSTVSLTTLVTNFDAAFGGNTCSSVLSDDWHMPVIQNTVTNFATLVGDPLGTYTLSDVDAYNEKLYVTASSVSGATKPTLFIFDISHPAVLTLLGKIDNEGFGGTVSTGLSAVRVAEDAASVPIKTYAYAANAYAANYTTCNPKIARNCGELAIFDVTNPAMPALGTNLMIASSSMPFVKGPQAKGVSILYKNGYVFLGLAATGKGNGPEFSIIDVHNLPSLFGASHIAVPIGIFSVGNDVNAIALRGRYVYLATPNSTEVQVLDVADPSSIAFVGHFNSSVGAGHGKSVTLVGNSLYLGVTVPNSGNDFHILDVTNPATTLSELGGLSMPSSVNAVIVRDYLSFVLTNSDLKIYDSRNPSHITAWASLPLQVHGHLTVEPSMDCEGNRLYVTSNDVGGHGSLYVIAPSP